MWFMTAPARTPADDQKLKDAGIAVPGGRFESDKLTYKINAPKLEKPFSQQFHPLCTQG